MIRNVPFNKPKSEMNLIITFNHFRRVKQIHLSRVKTRGGYFSSEIVCQTSLNHQFQERNKWNIRNVLTNGERHFRFPKSL